MNPHRRAFITSLVLLAAAGAVAGTSASFNAKTTNDAAFSTDALNNPTNVTVANEGYTVSYSWTTGTMTSGGSAYSHRLSTKVPTLGTVTGAAPTCTWSDTFGTTTTIPNATTSATVTVPNNRLGLWLCWRLDLQHPASGTPVWVSQSSPTGSIQIGFVVQSVTVANGGASGAIDAGDTIVIKLSQQALKTSIGSPTNVCFLTASKTSTTATIYVGRSTNTACASSSTLLGSFPVANAAIGNPAANWTPTYASTFAWQGSCNVANTACDELLITLGTRETGNIDPTATINSSSIFTPIATLQSFATVSGSPLPLCTANTTSTNFCKPTVSGSF
ncbi:MAG TPA: hypothetical protein VFU93_13395 [Acidimicrobiales bacterium]|nr:hypothetical protein [Acidimicrobiales bacterium]